MMVCVQPESMGSLERGYHLISLEPVGFNQFSSQSLQLLGFVRHWISSQRTNKEFCRVLKQRTGNCISLGAYTASGESLRADKKKYSQDQYIPVAP